MDRPLRKISEEGWLGGVCAGVAYWLGWPTWLVRIIVIVLDLELVYFLLWIFLPAYEETPADFAQVTGE